MKKAVRRRRRGPARTRQALWESSKRYRVAESRDWYGDYSIFDHNGTSSGGLLAGGIDPGDPGSAAEYPEENEAVREEENQ